MGGVVDKEGLVDARGLCRLFKGRSRRDDTDTARGVSWPSCITRHASRLDIPEQVKMTMLLARRAIYLPMSPCRVKHGVDHGLYNGKQILRDKTVVFSASGRLRERIEYHRWNKQVLWRTIYQA